MIDYQRPRLDDLVAEADHQVVALTGAAPARNVIAWLDRFDDVSSWLRDAASVSEALGVLHADADIRTAAKAARRRISTARGRLDADPAVHAALAAAAAAPPDAAAAHWLTRALTDGRRAGADLPHDLRDRVRGLRAELRAAETAYLDAVYDAVTEIEVPVADLDGLPADYLARHPVSTGGTTVLTTAEADLLPALAYAHSGALRERLWIARARGGGEVAERHLAEMRRLRHDIATVHGYPSAAAHALDGEMLSDPTQVRSFLEQAAAQSREDAAAEYTGLLERKRTTDPAATGIDPWDVEYLRRSGSWTGADLRDYLPLPRVLDGIRGFFDEYLGLTISEGAAATWHPDVLTFEAAREGRRIGLIHLDLYRRDGKPDEVSTLNLRTGKAGSAEPECIVTAALPRAGSGPTLLELSDVLGLFHEIGHAAHLILSGRARWGRTSGLRNERDFIEAPALLIEELVRSPEVIGRFARHHRTGEPAPAALLDASLGPGATSATDRMEQLFLSALSLGLHGEDPAIAPSAVERDLAPTFDPFGLVSRETIHLDFAHLAYYGAAYYTYPWSSAIARRLARACRSPAGTLEAGRIRRFRDLVLVPGGGAPAADLVGSFLDPATAAP